jgi:hypothetical protein
MPPVVRHDNNVQSQIGEVRFHDKGDKNNCLNAIFLRFIYKIRMALRKKGSYIYSWPKDMYDRQKYKLLSEEK